MNLVKQSGRLRQQATSGNMARTSVLSAMVAADAQPDFVAIQNRIDMQRATNYFPVSGFAERGS